MRTSLIAVLALLALSSARTQPAAPSGGGHASAPTAVVAAPRHGIVTPEKIVWKDGPPSLPAGAKFAVLEGDPAKEGYFAMRLLLPDGYQIPPHTPPNVERLTIVSGTFHLGHGERFDKGSAPALPAGSYSFMEPGMKHFAWAEGRTVVQLTTVGPWAINYVNRADDPRQREK